MTVLRLAWRNLMGAGIRTWLNVVVLSMSFVVIIGLLAAVATPSVGAGIDSVRLATATSSISAFLNSAVTYSERHQQAVEVMITPKESRFSALSSDGGYTRELVLLDGNQITHEEVYTHNV